MPPLRLLPPPSALQSALLTVLLSAVPSALLSASPAATAVWVGHQFPGQRLAGGGAALVRLSLLQCALTCVQRGSSLCRGVNFTPADGHCRLVAPADACLPGASQPALAAAAGETAVLFWPYCARSCLQAGQSLPAPPPLPATVLQLHGWPAPLLCDLALDGGGWTLLLTVASNAGLTSATVELLAEQTPSLTENYSILGRGDAIRDLGAAARFAYRIETVSQTGRQQWGGVWSAPAAYSFTHDNLDQTEVVLVTRFGNWDYSLFGIQKRMPWLNRGNGPAAALLTVTGDNDWWGTLVNSADSATARSPWIKNTPAEDAVTALYWAREE